MKRRSTVFTLCLCMAVALLVVQVNSKQRDGHDPAPSLRTSDFQSRDRVRPSNSSSRLKGKKRSSRPIVNAYQDWENVVTRSEVTWNDFVTFAPQPPRQKIYIKPSVLNSIIQCPSESTLNASKVCNVRASIASIVDLICVVVVGRSICSSLERQESQGSV